VIIRCLSPLPDEDQARRLGVGRNYLPGRQQFGLVADKEYVVFGLSIMDGEGWAYVLSDSGLLHPVPLLLFEVIDSRASRYWHVDVFPTGNLRIAPESFRQPYYFDDLSESRPEVVRDFARIRSVIEAEARSAPGG